MQNVALEIETIRKRLNGEILVLGHHYQSANVLKHADAIGDSLELARRAAQEKAAKRIVFCGVHFMAESADLLSGPEQKVFMPDTTANCPMAGMARAGEAEEAWRQLEQVHPGWVPVVYVNSTAEVKAFCGRHGGSACTSSNAARVFEWVIGQDKRVLFLPDEHLGTNSAHDLGIPDDQIAVYDPDQPAGALSRETAERARVVVWKGYCHVHTAFTVNHLKAARASVPEAKIIVHPETPKEVVRLADAHGSTSQIIRYVEQAPRGTTIFIGTELNLVQRLAGVHKDRVTIKPLAPSLCPNMMKTSEAKLLSLLRDWPERNRIHVPENLRVDAAAALDRMLHL